MFIDESGDIGLRPPYKSSHFVIGYVYCKNPDILRIHLKHYMKRLHSSGRYPLKLNELKFWLPWDALKKQGYAKKEMEEYRCHSQEIQKHTLSLVRDHSDAIQVAVLDKKTIVEPTWTPEFLWNFIFANTLFSPK